MAMCVVTHFIMDEVVTFLSFSLVSLPLTLSLRLWISYDVTVEVRGGGVLKLPYSIPFTLAQTTRTPPPLTSTRCIPLAVVGVLTAGQTHALPSDGHKGTPAPRSVFVLLSVHVHVYPVSAWRDRVEVLFFTTNRLLGGYRLK